MSRDEQLTTLLRTWLPTQRWFPDERRSIRAVTVVARTALVTAEDPLVDHVLADVAFDDDGPVHRYQVVVATGRAPEVPAQAVLGTLGDRTLYDGVWDARVVDRLPGAVRRGCSAGNLRFVAEPGIEIPDGHDGRVLGGEQSNTSVAWGDRSIFKLFRRVQPGVNPDLELHRVLRRQGSTHVVALQGALETTVDGTAATLGMLHDFVAGSADGWTSALRTAGAAILGAGTADERDFTTEALLLGEAVALVHRELAQGLGVERVPRSELAEGWNARLDSAVAGVPELAVHAPGIRAVYADFAASASDVLVQRVHGDLHLGQTLRTGDRWLVIDFEGEPSAPVDERRRPDSPLRDVGGMLRSFDYASLHEVLGSRAPVGTGVLRIADEWARSNRAAFLDGYARAGDVDPRSDTLLLRAFELDKAVYEFVYETRFRPTWVTIPLVSIERLVSGR